GMNPAEKARFMKTLDKIRHAGTTILLVEHDMRTVMGTSDRIICLNHGRIIADGTPGEIQSHPEVIRAYLGERAAPAGNCGAGMPIRCDRGGPRTLDRGTPGRACCPDWRQRGR